MPSETPSVNTMLPHVHNHIDQELRQIARTDTVFVIVAAFFNLIVLAINSAVAGLTSSLLAEGDPVVASGLIFTILLASTVVISVMSLRALSSSKRTRQALMDGLVQMYEDAGVAKYYQASVIQNYATRYTVFSVIIGILGGLAVIIPLVQLTF